MMRLPICQRRLGFLFLFFSFGFFFLSPTCWFGCSGFFLRSRSLSHCHNAETSPLPTPVANGFGYFFCIVRNFGDEDHIGTPCDPCSERKPSRAMAHDFHNDDPV